MVGAERVSDRRVARTKRLLDNALLSLIEERGYAATTVADIAERADVGRATFYLHYHDKEELLAESLERLLQAVTADVRPMTVTEVVSERMTQTTLLFRHVAERPGLYRALLTERGATLATSSLRRHLSDVMERNVTSRLVSEAVRPLPADLLASHAAGSLLGLVTWWLEHDQPRSPEEMGQLFQQLITPGVASVLGFPSAVDGPTP